MTIIREFETAEKEQLSPTRSSLRETLCGDEMNLKNMLTCLSGMGLGDQRGWNCGEKVHQVLNDNPWRIQ